MVILSSPNVGEDEDGSLGSTFHAATRLVKTLEGDCSSCRDITSSMTGRIKTAVCTNNNEETRTDGYHWNPEYVDRDHDEFLAFCLEEAVVVDHMWPEEEIVFLYPASTTSTTSRKKPSKSKSTIQKECNDTTEKKGSSKKAKSIKKKSIDKAEDGASALATKQKPKKKTSTRSESGDSRIKRKGKAKKQKSKKLDKCVVVDTIPTTLLKSSFHTASSTSVSLFGDDDASFAEDIVEADPTRQAVLDEEVLRLQQRINLIQAATEAASLGRLTRLSEKVVESVSEKPKEEVPKDTWQVKKSAADIDLNRSNHFQVIHEAAAMGQMKRVRSNALNLHGWAEYAEDGNRNIDLDGSRLETSEVSKPRFQQRRRKPLLSSHERIDRYVEDAVESKKKTLYAPVHLLERQDQNDQELARLLTGDLGWLPTRSIPTLVLPRVFLSRKRIRESLVVEVAEACSVRNRRLSYNFQLNIRKRCLCTYCEAPSAVQTKAYQMLQKQEASSDNPGIKPKRNNSAPKTLLRPSSHCRPVDPSKLYSRKILRARTEPVGADRMQQGSSCTPVWSSASLKKTKVIRKDEKDMCGEAAPIWALATGKRDNNDLPDWASDALRELVSSNSSLQVGSL